MKQALAILVAAALISGCAPKLYPVETRDSVRVEIRERLVRDTVQIEIPHEVERIITRDSVSRLENSYALSVAEIREGLLVHSLESKAQRLEVPVLVPVHDTTIIEKEARVERVEVNVLTKGQAYWIRTGKALFSALVVLLAAGLAVVAFKLYRKIRP